MNKKIIQRISLLILLFVLPIAYPVTDIHAQDVRVTIRMEKVRMEQVMNEIERQTKYLFGSAEKRGCETHCYGTGRESSAAGGA